MLPSLQNLADSLFLDSTYLLTLRGNQLSAYLINNMVSYPHSASLPSSSAPSTVTQQGIKRERENDNDELEKVPPRKKVTISRKACIVCNEDVPRNRFPKIPHKQDDNNKHSSDVCFKCFSEHLRIEVENKGHEGIGCPQCSRPLEESEIRKLASSWTYQEYATAVHTDNEGQTN